MYKPTALSVALIATLLSGCSFYGGKETEFHYLSPGDVKNEMQLMANQLVELETILRNEESSDTVRKGQIISILARLEAIAGTLRGGDEVVTNYSVINHYMGAFLYDVGVARQFALREPANLVPAGRLVKSCLSCHQSIVD